MGLRHTLVATLPAPNAQRVVREAVGKFRDGRGHGRKRAKALRGRSIQYLACLTTGRLVRLTRYFRARLLAVSFRQSTKENMAAKKKAKRTTLRSSKGKKLYAVRKADGTFKDIQTYKRAHGQDIKRKAKGETAKKKK
jgi:hypothetical protein